MVRLYPENQEVKKPTDWTMVNQMDRKYLVLAPGQKREQKFITAVLIDEDAGTEVRLKEGETLRVTIGDSAVETEIYFNLQADGGKCIAIRNRLITGNSAIFWRSALRVPIHGLCEDQQY